MIKKSYLVVFYSVNTNKSYTRSFLEFPLCLCTPSCLKAAAVATGALFVTCSKYGCKQFVNPIHPLVNEL